MNPTNSEALSDQRAGIIAGRLIETSLKRLVVRAALYRLPGGFPATPVAEIYLLSYCQPREGPGDLFEVLYFSRQDPTEWYSREPLQGLRVRPFPPGSLQEAMQIWIAEENHPLWCNDREVVAYTGVGRKAREVNPANLRLMSHFVRLYDLILMRAATTPNAWETDDLLKRLGAFLKDRLQEWDKVLG